MTSRRRARVLRAGSFAGELNEDSRGFCFTYAPEYLSDLRAPAISWTLPRREAPYVSAVLFPFFYGLLAEGALAELQCRLLKIDPSDSFGRLLRTAHGDVIGCVTVEPAP